MNISGVMMHCFHDQVSSPGIKLSAAFCHLIQIEADCAESEWNIV